MVEVGGQEVGRWKEHVQNWYCIETTEVAITAKQVDCLGSLGSPKKTNYSVTFRGHLGMGQNPGT